MAKEILAVPEGMLEEVIRVIRVGLDTLDDRVSDEVVELLSAWCSDEEDYLWRLRGVGADD